MKKIILALLVILTLLSSCTYPMYDENGDPVSVDDIDPQ